MLAPIGQQKADLSFRIAAVELWSYNRMERPQSDCHGTGFVVYQSSDELHAFVDQNWPLTATTKKAESTLEPTLTSLYPHTCTPSSYSAVLGAINLELHGLEINILQSHLWGVLFPTVSWRPSKTWLGLSGQRGDPVLTISHATQAHKRMLRFEVSFPLIDGSLLEY